MPELRWDPVTGCADSMVAERWAKAFNTGTAEGGRGDDPPVFRRRDGKGDPDFAATTPCSPRLHAKP